MSVTIRLPNGEEVDIDTSDRFQAADAAKKIWAKKSLEQTGPSWGETLATAKQNMPSPGEYIASQFTNPITDIKNVGKLGLGAAEHALGFTPDQQISNEQEVASQFGHRMGNYLTESGRKENLSKDPAGTLTDILSFGLAPARTALGAVRKAITPVTARPGFADASNILADEGVPQTAGQRTGNRTLKYAESELGGSRTSAIIDRQAEEYTRAASHRIGEDTPHLDPQTLNNARNRIGREFDAIGVRNNIPSDPQLAQDLQAAAQNYADSVPIAAPGVANIANAIAARSQAGIPGQIYNAFRSRLSRMQRNTRDPQLIAAYHDIREALDNAFERSLAAAGNQADLQALQTARQQYRNYIVLENAMASGAETTSRGLLTPAKLEQAAASGPNRTWYARGLSDFTDLGKAGKVGMSAMPESGTPIRAAIRGGAGLLGAAGGALVGGAISPEMAVGATVGAAAPFVMGRALMSRPVQSYLGNQVLPRTPAGPGMRMGRAIAPAVATAGDLRKDALARTENVLSPQVLEQTKRFAPRELNAWISTRSPEAAQSLARAIAAKVNRPDLVERITKELLAQ